jgi:hypothetical protein
VDFAINVALLNIHINNAHNYNINLLFVSIVEKKVILQDSVLKIRKVYTGKEDHALDVDLLDIYLRTARLDKKVVPLSAINNNFELYFVFL